MAPESEPVMMEPRYASPSTVSEVLDILAEHSAEATVLAGGQSLLVLLRQRLVRPGILVGLKRVTGLDAVAQRDGGLRIGATTTYRAVSETVGEAAPILAEAAASVGSVHIRNLGTVGGSVCHADPAGDVPTVLLVMDATAQVARAGDEGTTLPLASLFTGLFATRLAEDQLLTSVDVPAQPVNAGYAYRRFCFRAGEYPMAVAACRLEWDAGQCTGARVAVGGADAHPKRLLDLEDALAGSMCDQPTVTEAVNIAAQDLNPIPDVRGSAAWKRRVVTGLLEQTIVAASRETARA